MAENEIITTEIPVVEESQNTEIEEVVQVVEVEEIEAVTIEMNEVLVSLDNNGEQFNHSLLNNRESPNQHPIIAIEGLSDTLEQIKALKTVYSNKYNCASYYKWINGNILNENRNNLFVSACVDQNEGVAIDICNGDNIFGVTVSDAAFIGGQEYVKAENDSLIGRNYNYNAVVNFGLVSVRCVGDIAIGDYVTSNQDGLAIKSDGKYGYIVVNTCDIQGLPGVVVALLPSSEHNKDVAQNVDDLIQRMANTEYNIVGIRNLANSAYQLSTQQQNQHETDIDNIKEDIIEIIKELEDTFDFVENTNASLTNISVEVASAKTIANDAVLSANRARDEAIQTANDAWAKAEEVEESVGSLTAKISEYAVGEHSQAYGLTHGQIVKILKEEMVFVPTIDDIVYEVYSHRPYLDDNGNVQYVDYMQTFQKNNYYVCDFNTVIDNDGVAHIVFQWVSHVDGVNFSNGKLADGTTYIPAGSIASPYWVVTEADVEIDNEDGTKTIYNLGGLYKWSNASWHKVASIADNTLSRAISLVSQTANEISMDITNAKGDFATFAAKISDSDAKIQTATNFLTGEYITIECWDDDLANEFADPSSAYKTEYIYYDKTNELYYYYVNNEGWKSTNDSFQAGLKGNLSIIDQSSDKDGSKMALVVSGLHGEEIVNGASIVLSQNESGSYIAIDADKINFLSKEFNIHPSDGNGNKTSNEANFSVDAEGNVNIKGTVYADAGNIGNIIIDEGAIVSQNGNFSVDAEGNLIVKGKGQIGQCIIDNNLLTVDSISSLSTNLGVVNAGVIQSINYNDGQQPTGFKISCEDVNMINSPYFKVTQDGKITSTEGKIGGWYIGTNTLSNDENTALATVGLSTGYNDGDENKIESKDLLCFWAGNISSAAPFKVYQDGSFFAESGQIGEDVIIQGQIQVGTQNSDTKIYIGKNYRGIQIDHQNNGQHYFSQINYDEINLHLINENNPSLSSNFYIKKGNLLDGDGYPRVVIGSNHGSDSGNIEAGGELRGSWKVTSNFEALNISTNNVEGHLNGIAFDGRVFTSSFTGSDAEQTFDFSSNFNYINGAVATARYSSSGGLSGYNKNAHFAIKINGTKVTVGLDDGSANEGFYLLVWGEK